jgi:hypothetical protein
MRIVHRGAGSQVQVELGNYGKRQHKRWFECVERPGGDRLIWATRRTWCGKAGDIQPSKLYRGIIPRCHSAGAIQGIDFLEASRAKIVMSTKPDDSGDSRS